MSKICILTWSTDVYVWLWTSSFQKESNYQFSGTFPSSNCTSKFQVWPEIEFAIDVTVDMGLQVIRYNFSFKDLSFQANSFDTLLTANGVEEDGDYSSRYRKVRNFFCTHFLQNVSPKVFHGKDCISSFSVVQNFPLLLLFSLPLLN